MAVESTHAALCNRFISKTCETSFSQLKQTCLFSTNHRQNQNQRDMITRVSCVSWLVFMSLLMIGLLINCVRCDCPCAIAVWFLLS